MSLGLQSRQLAQYTDDGVEWTLRRNCSLTPAQMGLVFGMLAAVSISVSGFFWAFGAPLVAPFAVLELTALGIAFVVYARHAADRERIRLSGGRLLVEQEVAGRVQRSEFESCWVQVVPMEGRHPLIEVRCGPRSVHVGRHLHAELRPALAKELRQALRRV